jgi:hypothetical protein
MINFNITINNFFNKDFKHLWGGCFSTVFLHKFIEYQLYRDSTILAISFDWSIRRDHAGLNICIGLLSYCFDFNFYDNRHWNHQERRYETHKE